MESDIGELSLNRPLADVDKTATHLPWRAVPGEPAETFEKKPLKLIFSVIHLHLRAVQVSVAKMTFARGLLIQMKKRGAWAPRFDLRTGSCHVVLV